MTESLYTKFSQLLPNLQDRQRDVVFLTCTGHSVVLGTAGSGKTTMAILRAAWLCSADNPQAGRTLLVTFSSALVKYIISMMNNPSELREKLCSLDVRNYYQFACGYLRSRNQERDIEKNQSFWISKAAEKYKTTSKDSDLLNLTTEFLRQELDWTQGLGVYTRSEYLSLERKGRVTPLDRVTRNKVFDVFEIYRKIRKRPYDYSSIATAVKNNFASDKSERMYKHIVIDEGQDFSPEILRSLVMAVPSDGSVTFFGDMAQQIFGKRLSWKSAGFKTQKVWHFQENYRNTPEVMKLANEITRMPYFTEVTEDLIIPKSVKASGAKPTLVRCANHLQEVNLIVERAKELSKSGLVLIATRRRDDEKHFVDLLPKESIRVDKYVPFFNSRTGLYYGAYASVKGMEFDSVILPFFSEERLPDPAEVEDHGLLQAEANDGKLIYVAITRAKSLLLITYTGRLTSLLRNVDISIFQKENLK